MKKAFFILGLFFSKALFAQYKHENFEKKWILDSLEVNNNPSPKTELSKKSFLLLKSDSLVLQKMGDQEQKGKWYLLKDSIIILFERQKPIAFKIVKQSKDKMVWALKTEDQNMVFFLRGAE